MRLSVRFLALLVVISGLGFAAWTLATQMPRSPWYISRWEEVGDGLRRMEFVSRDRVNVLVYSFDPSQVDLRIEQNQAAERVSTWSKSLTGDRLVTNGFYFLENNTPAGLLISDGVPLHQQEFDQDKSGVVELSPQFAIIDTSTQTFKADDMLEGGQSYPFLLKQGQPAIAEDSGFSARRTFIGTDAAGMGYIGVVWRNDVSLFELMNVLQEMDVHWANVINLDGGPSTGLSVDIPEVSETFDSAAPVPNVIVLQPK